MAYGSGGYGRSSSFRRGNFNRFRGPRQMTKIKCSECGKEDEVPFKPREGTPVYCKECFLKKRGITPRESKPKEQEELTESTEESEEPIEETEESEED